MKLILFDHQPVDWFPLIFVTAKYGGQDSLKPPLGEQHYLVAMELKQAFDNHNLRQAV
ncbi:MAG: hypothetical protein OEZ30_06500 [Candidatus Aminicenantes bacterium]|nr:hypothetical protein [Candidatus Aminicenantes bacterium]MDH5715194.1 hypothetical protein [Candidatus Aminicenantes bacterium]